VILYEGLYKSKMHLLPTVHTLLQRHTADEFVPNPVSTQTIPKMPKQKHPSEKKVELD
jgi:hypothetical protein